MFNPIRIAPVPGLGFVSTPTFQTDVKSAQSGREYRNGDWDIVRHRFDCPYKNITNEAYLAIKEVFLVSRGKLHTFLHRDWSDYAASNSVFGEGDGTTKVFQLAKTSQVGAASYVRAINKPVLDGLIVRVNGTVSTDANVDPLTGLVTFNTAPSEGVVLSWTGEFDVQVRFDTDELPYSIDDRNDQTYVLNGTLSLYEVIDE